MVVLPILALISNRSISIMNIQLSIFNFYSYLLLIKTIFELFFLYPVAKFFNQTKLLWWFPIAQPFHIVYTVIAGWLGKFGKYTWKERSVK